MIQYFIQLIIKNNNSGKSNIIAHVFRLKSGDDLFNSIKEYVNENKIKAGFIMSCVGSLQEINIRLANADKFLVRKEHYEIVSLVGCVSCNNRFHLHISISDSEGNTKGGHLKDKNIVYTTAEIVIGELPELNFSEVNNPGEDWPELQIEQKK